MIEMQTGVSLFSISTKFTAVNHYDNAVVTIHIALGNIQTVSPYINGIKPISMVTIQNANCVL